ncbi:hypothetical protein [Mycobacterium uberis]|uniref:hypothetical protein n=1 Tax=Mycobacterium uberis TaxID=2162698 RepID=UPI0014021FA9|nr:hypothetical protein [Mycobacterium uberis]
MQQIFSTASLIPFAQKLPVDPSTLWVLYPLKNSPVATEQPNNLDLIAVLADN